MIARTIIGLRLSDTIIFTGNEQFSISNEKTDTTAISFVFDLFLIDGYVLYRVSR